MTSTPSIPDWSIHGTLPPIRPGTAATSPERSPYVASSLDFCLRLGQTCERRSILRGLFALRAVLRAAGLADGFQWIDGSFAEDCEGIRGRAPGDVDVVTFIPLGDRARQQQLVASHRVLFVAHEAKAHFRVDHYVVATDRAFDSGQARWVSYWYSMWSHRRDDERWKGFVELSLSDDDADAAAWLARQDIGGATGEANDEQ
ncbi:MAG: hypothetical protein WCA32_09385 [Chromatiaceae bacterium]|jgi:hypothetical protein